MDNDLFYEKSNCGFLLAKAELKRVKLERELNDIKAYVKERNPIMYENWRKEWMDKL